MASFGKLIGVSLIIVIFCSSGILCAKQFKSETVIEQPCGKNIPATNLLADWIAKVPAWYVQMGSAYFFHQWVEKLTNQSGGPEQIANLCLKLLYLAADKPNAPYMVLAGGLNKAANYKCKAEGPHQQICDGVQGSPNYKPGPESEDTLVLTDNKHYALMFRCTHKKFKSWYVLTPSTVDLTPEVKKEALLFAVKNGGFDKKYGSMISYQKCPRPSKQPKSGDAIANDLVGGVGGLLGGVGSGVGGLTKGLGVNLG